MQVKAQETFYIIRYNYQFVFSPKLTGQLYIYQGLANNQPFCFLRSDIMEFENELIEIITMLEGKLTAEEMQKVIKFINKITGYEN